MTGAEWATAFYNACGDTGYLILVRYIYPMIVGALIVRVGSHALNVFDR